MRLVASIALLAVVVAAHGSDLDASRLAGALRLREGYRGVDGRLGERGPWQIRAATWAQHMPGTPFARAVQEGPALACALKHIAWISAGLETRGVPATPFNVAAAWNAGLDRYTSGHAPARAYLYAGDVERFYEAARPRITSRRRSGAHNSGRSSVRTTVERPPASPVALPWSVFAEHPPSCGSASI